MYRRGRGGRGAGRGRGGRGGRGGIEAPAYNFLDDILWWV